MDKFIEPHRYLFSLRKSKGLTLHEVANRAGCSHNAIALIEKGVNIPRDSLLSKLCEIYSIDEDKLFLLYDRVPPRVEKILLENETLMSTLRKIAMDRSITGVDKDMLFKLFEFSYHTLSRNIRSRGK